jgi:hypothetical protein
VNHALAVGPAELRNRHTGRHNGFAVHSFYSPRFGAR